MSEKYLTVSQINATIKRKLNMDPTLKNILVQGEISNYSPSMRHDYFDLKDENSLIHCIMYINNKKRFLDFEPKDGMKVIIKGRIDVFEKNGKYQLAATRIIRDGQGTLQENFLKLKEKLEKEGLFDASHKKEIPKYPKRIGVVTAKTGAAIKDIIITIKKRYPVCKILVFPTLVQGDNAAAQIASQIKFAQNFHLDTLIVGRGGGSTEDLWPFNEEIVARAIYECDIPTISAVGHETDFTIADFTADKRAPTPTGAAVIAVPDINELQNRVNQLDYRLNKNINEKVESSRIRLENIKSKQIIRNPESIYNMKGMHLDNLLLSLNSSFKNRISESRNRIVKLENSPIFKNPQNIYENKEIKLEKLITKLNYTSKNIITENRNKIFKLENSAIFKNPQNIYENKEIKLEKLITKLNYTSKNIITENRNKMFKVENSTILKNPNLLITSKREACLKNIEKLEILNPLDTLKRGYTLTKMNEKVISSSKDLKKGDELEIEFNDGTVNTKVI